MYIYNFTTTTVEEDLELFFGPLEKDDEFIHIQPNWVLAHVMHAAGCFSSISQARKNGWNKPIESGYSEYVVGKRKVRIHILNV